MRRWSAVLATMLFATFSLLACGPGMAERIATDAAQRERLERRAVRWIDTSVSAPPGKVAELQLELRIAEGFYLPAGASADAGIEPLSIEPPRASFVRVERLELPPQPQLVRFDHRREPLLCYEGVQQVRVRLLVAAGTPPGKHKLTFVAVWQQCTLHGCSVPRRDGVEVWLDVQPATANNLDDLAQ
jgi:hypothetical protein